MKKELLTIVGLVLILTTVLCIAGFEKKTDVSLYYDELQKTNDKNAYFNSLPIDIQTEIIKQYFPEEWEFLNLPWHTELEITKTMTIDGRKELEITRIVTIDDQVMTTTTKVPAE